MGRYVFQDHFNIFSRNEKVELKNCSPIYYVGKKSCMAGQKVGSTYIAQIYIYIFHCHRVAVFLPQHPGGGTSLLSCTGRAAHMDGFFHPKFSTYGSVFNHNSGRWVVL